MKNTTVYLTQLPEPVQEMARLAAREIFSHGQLIPVRTVGEAVQLPGQSRQLLVVGDTSEADLGVAAQAVDAGDLPRWAVVHIGMNPSDLVETVPAGECSVRLLARVFRSAMLHHELLRENLLLRGDLKTLARRYNHDIRTPLGCINTLCILLTEMSAGDIPPLRETVGAIQEATAEIDALLERVAFIVKATSEPLPAAPFAMGLVVQKVVQQLMAAHERRAIKFQQPAQPWPEVRAVEPWIEFVWTHLLQNALRHGAKNGPIQLGWEMRGTEQRFWVASKGAVPRAQQAHLLRPFHLLHQQTSAGLGLSLVERLVALQGGRAGYETGAEDHAVFYFTLPAGPSGARANGSGPARRPRYADSRATP